jgi:hypothetical protein
MKKLLVMATVLVAGVVSAKGKSETLKSENVEYSNKSISTFIGGFCTVIIYSKDKEGNITIIRAFSRWTETDAGCKQLKENSMVLESFNLDSSTIY